MADLPPVHLRTPDEMTPDERLQLEKALDSGVTELPPNQLKGFLGEKGPDMRQPEDFTPDLNAGLLQENDPGVMWLVIILAYLLLFPIAYVVLWRSKFITRRTKWVVSVIGAAGIAFVAARIIGV
jgi:hypothetical protein